MKKIKKDCKCPKCKASSTIEVDVDFLLRRGFVRCPVKCWYCDTEFWWKINNE